MWSLLLVTLPTQPNAVRLRIWRALKALGCAALRDGAYVLPAHETAALEALAVEVRDNGGQASVLSLLPRNELQKQEVLAQFDRSEACPPLSRTSTASASSAGASCAGST